jgi:hypothetical protein
MIPFTRWTLVRYWYPFDGQGRLDILLLARHADRYCRRNLFVVAVLLFLQPLLTGISPWGLVTPRTVVQAIYVALYVPFTLMAVLAGLVWMERRPPPY